MILTYLYLYHFPAQKYCEGSKLLVVQRKVELFTMTFKALQNIALTTFPSVSPTIPVRHLLLSLCGPFVRHLPTPCVSFVRAVPSQNALLAFLDLVKYNSFFNLTYCILPCFEVFPLFRISLFKADIPWWEFTVTPVVYSWGPTTWLVSAHTYSGLKV